MLTNQGNNTIVTDLEKFLAKIYVDEELQKQSGRFSDLINKYTEKFGNDDFYLFSSPGRTEISGNHTDHNHGKVIAASIDIDSIAVSSVAADNKVILYSDGYKEPFEVDLNMIEPVENEQATTSALIRGVAAGFKKYGFKTGGFNAFISSEVLVGSGLSSSASIEVLIGTIFNHFYNEGKVSYEKIALAGQYAENNFFGKPCGLMDQVACAAGGIVAIDFRDPENPLIEKINFDFEKTGYKLIVVDTGGNHADLTDDYSSIPGEMKQVAKYFGKEFCRNISFMELLSGIKSIRNKLSDRAILRAIHFIEENKRVNQQIKALKEDNFSSFLSLVNQSGDSSFKYLQNVYSHQDIEEQGTSLALALSDIFIKQIGAGACRIHGGGFAGTIVAFIPVEHVEDYKKFLSPVFSEDSVKVLSIRKQGAICLNK